MVEAIGDPARPRPDLQGKGCGTLRLL